jgi:hypothetical protein
MALVEVPVRAAAHADADASGDQGAEDAPS